MQIRKRKILIIEDERDLGGLIRDFLTAAGYEVMHATDGSMGQDLALQFKPDLILMDFIMPKRRGDEVVKFLQDQPSTRSVPVVIMSGLLDMNAPKPNASGQDKFLNIVSQGHKNGNPWTLMHAEEIVEYGVTAFLAKPFTKKTLLDLAGLLLEKKGTENDGR